MTRLRAEASLLLFIATACADFSAPPSAVVATTNSDRSISTSGTWTTVATLTPRYQHAAAVGPDGRIYVVGGNDGGGPGILLVEVLDPVTGSVTAATPLPAGRVAHVAAQTGGHIYVIGGLATPVQFLTSVIAYDPATGAWTSKASLPSHRHLAAAAVGLDGRIYVAGGWQNSSTFTNPTATAVVYDPATDTWSAIASMPMARGLFAMATGADGRIYAIGGIECGSFGCRHTASVDVYEPATNTWVAVASMPTTRAFHAAATGLDGGIYVLGGSVGGTTNTVVAYDPATNAWSAVPSMANNRRAFAAVAGLDGVIYAIGGENEASVRLGVVEAYPTRLDPEEAVDAIGDAVAALLGAGSLDAGNATSLQGSLDAAAAAIASGNTSAAEGQLGAFIKKVNALVKSGRLTVAEGASLVSAAEGVLAEL